MVARGTENRSGDLNLRSDPRPGDGPGRFRTPMSETSRGVFVAIARWVRGASLAWLLAATVMAAFAGAPPAAVAPRELGWDENEKTFFGLPGDTSANFVFTAKNSSSEEVTVTEITPSCGCTVVEMPPTPWTLAPGATRAIRVTVDVRDKRGDLEKTLHVVSSLGEQTLLLRLFMPGSPIGDARINNQRRASVDRQAVFRGQCARCHVPPATVTSGEGLFQSACAVCHEASHRATMVPDLAAPRVRRDAAFWRRWISEGRANSLMPAFAQAEGGILSPAQIAQLVAYLAHRFPATLGVRPEETIASP